MNDRVSQAANTLVVLDEYKNDLDIRKIAYLKGLWGGCGLKKRKIRTRRYGHTDHCQYRCGALRIG